MTAPKTIAFLDPLHDVIQREVLRLLPSGWRANFAATKEFDIQRAAAVDADAIFVFATPVRAKLIEEAPRLRIVHKLGAGIDNIDVDVCAGKGVAVARLEGGNAAQVAEFTVLMMLATSRRLAELDRRTRAGEWLKEDSRGLNHQLLGKRVGIVGLGAIGKEVAKRLAAFGTDIVYFDPRALTSAEDAALSVRRVELDELLRTSDIISLHLPLVPQTVKLIDAERLRLLKEGAIIVNCARGGLIDEAALIAALKTGRLGVAGLDTFATEPPLGSELLTLPNVIVTPHVAGVTLENFSLVLATALKNTVGYFHGRALPAACVVVSPPLPPSSGPASFV